jgi:DNA-binding beta-propeller fold protein YncE
MINKGSPAVPGVVVPYLNAYYCTSCLPAWWGLKTSNITETSATVSWTTNDPQGTVLYFGSDPNSLAQYYSNPTLMTAHTVNITGLTTFTTYYYYVGEIIDSHGRHFTPPGSQSDGTPAGFKPSPASFTTLDLQPPTAPANLHTTSIGLTFITIAWDASSDNVGIASYQVYRKKSSDTSFALVGTTTATTLNNTLLQSNTSYDFRVRAKDLAGNNSDFSNVISATTLQPPPPPTAACSDHIDNDGDGKIDYPTDPGCNSPADNDETDTGGGGGGGACTEPTPSRLYFSNRASGANSIVPVDLNTSTTPPVYKNVGTPIPVPDTPGELAANPKGKTLYAIVGTDLAVIDVVSNTIVETIPIGGVSDTHHVVVSPDGKTVYVAYRYSPGVEFRIAVIDASTNTVTDTITNTSNPDNSSFEGCYLPIGLGINPTGNPLYLACRDVDPIMPDRFFMIDTTTKAPMAGTTFSHFSKDQDAGYIDAMAVRPDGLKVYVVRLDTSFSTVEVFDGITGDHTKTISLPLHAAPRAAVATLDDLSVYVVDQGLGTHLINADTDTRVKTLTRTTSWGFDIALSPDGTQLYMMRLGSLYAWDISTSSQALLATITGAFTAGYQVTIVPGAPGEPCAAPAPSRLYFSNTTTSAYSVVPVDLDTGATPPVYKKVDTPIPMPKIPGELASIPSGANKGRYLYAVVGSDLAVIDVVGNQVINTYSGAGGVANTHQMVISPDGKTLYLAYRSTNTKPVKTFRIKAFDINDDPKEPTLKALITDPAFTNCIIPIGIGIHPSGNPLYVACRDAASSQPDRFLLVDTATNIATLASTFVRDSNQSFINSISVRPDGTKVYLTKSATLDKIELFDGITGAHSKSISLPNSSTPKGGVITLDNLKVYVVDQGLGTHLIDSDTDTYVKTLTRLSSYGFGIAMTPDGTQIYPLHLNKLYAWDISTSPETLLATVTGAFTSGIQITITPGGSP